MRGLPGFKHKLMEAWSAVEQKLCSGLCGEGLHRIRGFGKVVLGKFAHTFFP